MLRVEAASDKDEPPPDRQTARQLLHRLYFITKRYNIIVIFIRLIHTLHADEARGEQLLRHAHGSRACRRREKKRLPLRREESDKSTHIVEMLLTEESVELVQDEDLHTHEFQLTEAVQFLHARCRTDDEGRLLLECFDLPLDVRSADERLHPDRQSCRLYEFTRNSRDLHREFVRRCEDERLCRTHGRINACQQWQEIGKCLARPCRCLADQILSRIRSGDQCRLYLRRHRDAALCKRGREMLGHAERCKVHSLLLQK